VSVHKRTRNGTTTWRVFWTEHGRQRSRTFHNPKDAQAFQRELDRISQFGELADELAKRRLTVNQLVGAWIDRRAGEVTEQTATDYARHFAHRVLPYFDERTALSITPGDIEAWIAHLRRQGDRDPTIVKACTALQAVFTLAVKDGLMPSNPVAAATKPSQRRSRVPYTLTIGQTEHIRHHMLAKASERDVVILELLAYAGLRPESEALPLTWRHVGPTHLLIRDTKRGRERHVPYVIAHLKATLRAWRLRSGRPPQDALVVPARDGGPWTRDEWRYWRRHVFAPAAAAAGLPADTRPRDLRGSWGTLLIHAGHDIAQVARWGGHDPKTALRDYWDAADQHSRGQDIDPDAAIAAARGATSGAKKSA